MSTNIGSHKVPYAIGWAGRWYHQEVTTQFWVLIPSLVSQLYSLTPGQLLPSDGPTGQHKFSIFRSAVQAQRADSLHYRFPSDLVQSHFTSHSHHTNERNMQYSLYVKTVDGQKPGNKVSALSELFLQLIRKVIYHSLLSRRTVLESSACGSISHVFFLLLRVYIHICTHTYTYAHSGKASVTAHNLCWNSRVPLHLPTQLQCFRCADGQRKEADACIWPFSSVGLAALMAGRQQSPLRVFWITPFRATSETAWHDMTPFASDRTLWHNPTQLRPLLGEHLFGL